jgi:hypothetical protein
MAMKQLRSLKKLVMHTQKIQLLQFVHQTTLFQKLEMESNDMPLYECNEHQFVENIRRLMETSARFVVNRKMELRDDGKYGPSILPNQEFDRYTAICTRKSLRSTVF